MPVILIGGAGGITNASLVRLLPDQQDGCRTYLELNLAKAYNAVMKCSQMWSERGFTLIEMMVVVAIISILLLIVLPGYSESMKKSRRADGMRELMELAARQERFFAQNSAYTTDIDSAAGLNLGRTDSSEGHYALSAAACATGTINSCYLLTATAQNAQASDTGCANLTLDSLGQKNASGTLGSQCW